jgi:hypothetical protein
MQEFKKDAFAHRMPAKWLKITADEVSKKAIVFCDRLVVFLIGSVDCK